jgi:hypothetical protein
MVVVWAAGFALFLRAPSTVSVELAARFPHPAEEHDLAAARFGPTLRVSSYMADVYRQHHPAFLVDERKGPTRTEKWASDSGDHAPWVEIRWRGVHDVSRVVVEHAGIAEDPGLTVHTYTLTCLTATGRGPSLSVHDNNDAVATHKLECHGAVGVRADFTLDGLDIARIFEIAAWGR